MWYLRGRRAVVVGAGSVACRKARALREAEADVTVVTGGPACPLDGVQVIAEPYRTDHLTGAALVLACTDDASVNARVAADARAAGTPVNVADMPEMCDFHLPAVARDGDVVVAIGTGAAAPALAGHLRDVLREALPAGVGDFAEALSTLRAELKQRGVAPSDRMTALRELAGDDGLAAWRRGGSDALRARLDELLAGGA
jgi:siroheme synthase-like protein